MKERENDHSNTTCYGQDPLIDANISGQNFKKQGISIASKYLQKCEILINYCGSFNIGSQSL